MDLCVSIGSNLGAPKCDVELGALKTLIFTRGKEFSKEELSSVETLKAAIQAAALLGNDDPNKVYVLPIFHSVGDNTGDPGVETFDDGLEQVTNVPVPKYTLQSALGYCRAQALGAFNNWQGKTYVIDSNNRFGYVRRGDGGGRGFQVGSFFSDAPRFRAYTGLRSIISRISFASVTEFQSGLALTAAINFDPQGLVNIQNVLLKDIESAGNVFTIRGEVACTEENVYAAYKTLLADADAWRVTRADTGAVVAIESVTVDDVLGAWDITIAAGVATGTKLVISLVSPDALDALGIEGLESVPLTVTKAA